MKPTKSQGLLAVGSAVLIAAYAAGYARTDEAARRMADAGKGQRPVADDASEASAASIAITTKAAQAVAQQAALTAAPAAEPAPAVPPHLVYSSAGISLVTQPDVPGRMMAKFMAKPDIGSHSVPETLADLPQPVKKWKDGRWSGVGTCPHGTMTVEVEIVGGQIAECVITECHTNYDGWMVRNLTGQVVVRQSTNIGTMSSATQSSDAFYYGVVAALQSAEQAAM